MVKKTIFISLLFFISLIYLNQKVAIYIEAYKLNTLYQHYNKLVNIRDTLLYNFSQKTSLPKINSWLAVNNFRFADADRVVALNVNNNPIFTNHTLPQVENKKYSVLASYFKHIFRFPNISKAFAKNQN